MQKELLQKPQIETIGKHIGYEAGEEMVKSFYDKHPDQAYGHIVGRDIIEHNLIAAVLAYCLLTTQKENVKLFSLV